MTFLNTLKSTTLLLALFTLASCGGSKPMVNDVKVSTSVVDGDIHLSLSADLSIGNVLLPNASIPIILPKSGKEIGHVSLVNNGQGENTLGVDLNISETANLDLDSARLPNGTMIPLIADRQVIVVPIGKGTEVYISITGDQAAVGVAVPIKSFDQMGSKVGTSSLMPIFQTNGVIGAAGVFTSREAGKNGIALIADVSSFLGDFVNSNKIENHAFRMQQQQSSLDYSVQAPSRRAEKKINKELYKLHRKRRVLQLH
jgi:hypothetical protein